MDLLFDTIYWGPAFDDPSACPPYVKRWRPLHKLIFGIDPMTKVEEMLEKEMNVEQKQALAERRRRIMIEKKNL